MAALTATSATLHHPLLSKTSREPSEIMYRPPYTSWCLQLDPLLRWYHDLLLVTRSSVVLRQPWWTNVRLPLPNPYAKEPKGTTSQQQELERECERDRGFVSRYGYGYGRQYAQPQPQCLYRRRPTFSSGFPGSGLTQVMRSGTTGMTESFIGRGGENTTAAPASKRALVNERDSLSWARSDTLNKRYVCRLSTCCSFDS